MAKIGVGLDLFGKVAVVTGASSGIGFYTAKALALSGAHVFVGGRNEKKLNKAVEDINVAVGIGRAKGKAEPLVVDVSSLRTVQQAATEWLSKGLPLHILVQNAGIWEPPDALSEDGFEITLATNHFGPFYLLQLLQDRLKESAPSRIVIVTSAAEAPAPPIEWDNLEGKGMKSDFKVYALTKLLNLMTAHETSKRMKGTGVTVVAAQPGLVKTGLWSRGDHSKASALFQRAFEAVAGQSSERGAQPLIRAATDPSFEGKEVDFVVGPYYKNLPIVNVPFIANLWNTSTFKPENPQALDDEATRKLYNCTEQIIQGRVKSLHRHKA